MASHLPSEKEIDEKLPNILEGFDAKAIAEPGKSTLTSRDEVDMIFIVDDKELLPPSHSTNEDQHWESPKARAGYLRCLCVHTVERQILSLVYACLH